MQGHYNSLYISILNSLPYRLLTYLN